MIFSVDFVKDLQIYRYRATILHRKDFFAILS